jgi:hypothetical protein
MALEIVGKIVQILDLQTGTSAKGDWKKQEFILETEEQYPRKVCIILWNDRISDIASVQLGTELITASIEIASREFNGKWYTDVRAWKIQRGGVQVTPNATQSAPQSNASVPPSPSAPPADDNYANTGGESFDDLPF